MADGHLNKCIDCTKKDTKNRINMLKNSDPSWVEKEAARQRDKEKRRYHTKLKGTDYLSEKRKKSSKKYKEKYPEKYKAKCCTRVVPAPEGYHNHHWSYQEQYCDDVIQLSESNHFFIHRYIKYDDATMCYRTKKGVLLDTKAKHVDFINNLLTSFDNASQIPKKYQGRRVCYQVSKYW